MLSSWGAMGQDFLTLKRVVERARLRYPGEPDRAEV
jgi:hypothetical protein